MNAEARPVTEQFDDERLAARARLIVQLAWPLDSTRPAMELHDRFRREVERDFPVMTPADRERIERLIRRVTNFDCR